MKTRCPPNIKEFWELYVPDFSEGTGARLCQNEKATDIFHIIALLPWALHTRENHNCKNIRGHPAFKGFILEYGHDWPSLTTALSDDQLYKAYKCCQDIKYAARNIRNEMKDTMSKWPESRKLANASTSHERKEAESVVEDKIDRLQYSLKALADMCMTTIIDLYKVGMKDERKFKSKEFLYDEELVLGTFETEAKSRAEEIQTRLLDWFLNNNARWAQSSPEQGALAGGSSRRSSSDDGSLTTAGELLSSPTGYAFTGRDLSQSREEPDSAGPSRSHSRPGSASSYAFNAGEIRRTLDRAYIPGNLRHIQDPAGGTTET